MTVRLFEIVDAAQALPTEEPNYVTRSIFAYGFKSFTRGVLEVSNGFGVSGCAAWGARDDFDGVVSGMGVENSIIASFDLSGSEIDPPLDGFYGIITGVSSFLGGRLFTIDNGCGQIQLGTHGGDQTTLCGLLTMSGVTLQSKVGVFQLTSTGSLSITGLGFRPQLVLFGGANHNFFYAPSANPNPYGLMFGAATATDQFATCVGGSYLSGLNPGVSGRTCRTDNTRCLVNVQSGSVTPYVLASFQSMDADGFTINATVASNNNLFWYIAYADPGGDFAVGSGTQGDSSISPGFTPEGVMFAGAGNTAFGTNQSGAVMGFGAAAQNPSGIAQFAGFGGGGAANRITNYWNADAIAISKQVSGDSHLNGLADVTSFGPTTNLNWSINDGSGCKFGWVALNTSSGPGYAGCGLIGQIYRWMPSATLGGPGGGGPGGGGSGGSGGGGTGGGGAGGGASGPGGGGGGSTGPTGGGGGGSGGPGITARNAAGVINWGNLHITANTDRFGWAFASGGNEFAVAALPNVLAVQYKSILSASTLTDGRNYGLTGQEAIANGWAMLDTNHNVMYSQSFPTAVLLDLANPQMQAALAAAIIANGNAIGCNAIFLDDVVAQSNGYASVTPLNYGTQALWENGMVSAMNAVGAAIKAAGFYVIGNTYKSGSQLGTVTFARRFASAVSGIMFEGNSNTPWFDFQDALAAVTAAQAFTNVFVLIIDAPDGTLCNQSCAQFMTVWNGVGGGHVLAPDNNASDGWGAWTAQFGAT